MPGRRPSIRAVLVWLLAMEELNSLCSCSRARESGWQPAPEHVGPSVLGPADLLEVVRSPRPSLETPQTELDLENNKLTLDCGEVML